MYTVPIKNARILRKFCSVRWFFDITILSLLLFSSKFPRILLPLCPILKRKNIDKVPSDRCVWKFKYSYPFPCFHPRPLFIVSSVKWFWLDNSIVSRMDCRDIVFHLGQLRTKSTPRVLLAYSPNTVNKRNCNKIFTIKRVAVCKV